MNIRKKTIIFSILAAIIFILAIKTEQAIVKAPTNESKINQALTNHKPLWILFRSKT